ncbi:hypothetical protein CT694_27510 [Bacillus wiedmannii bv. thuringiensis]|nr:hypothetical protein CT694_27510 [Bacillus wiedmannii bv. thuringiensis]
MYKQLEEVMDKQQIDALEKWKEKTGLDKSCIPHEYKKLIEGAFLQGYDIGSIIEMENMKALSKLDPVGFYKWLTE